MQNVIEHQTKETPFDPRDSSGKFRRIQEMLDKGISYRAISRLTGMSKSDLKAIQIKTTGRFYFVPSKTSVENQVLVAERYDPITGQLSSPAHGVRFFSNTAYAWSWLQGQRVLHQFKWDQKKRLDNIRQTYLADENVRYWPDPTPAGL